MQEYNSLFASQDFKNRNLSKKRADIKVVVTEEALDDWRA